MARYKKAQEHLQASQEAVKKTKELAESLDASQAREHELADAMAAAKHPAAPTGP